MPEILKVLSANKLAPYQKGITYRIGKLYRCENFDTSDKECAPGFYGCTIDQLIYWHKPYNGTRVFLANVSGQSMLFPQKQRWENMKLVRELKKPEIIQLCKDNEVRLGYKLSEALYPFNPLHGKPKTPTAEDIELLKQLASVRDSVHDSVRASVFEPVLDSMRISVRGSAWDSVWSSVRGSVHDSVLGSAWSSVWSSVHDSVWISVHAYIDSLCLGGKKGKDIAHKPRSYPFQPAVDLWYRGFVPSFDGKTWRLHSGKDAKIVWEEECQ